MAVVTRSNSPDARRTHLIPISWHRPRDTKFGAIVAASPAGVSDSNKCGKLLGELEWPANGFSLETKARWPRFLVPARQLPVTSRAESIMASCLAATLPVSNSGYFRLIQNVLPRSCRFYCRARPNRAKHDTGKIGTPDEQVSGVPLTLPVNACDSTWHIIPSVTDTVHLTNTDTAAALPFRCALVNGP